MNANAPVQTPPRWRGPVIGFNQQGYPAPVFYDTHTAINMKSKSGGIVITGAPGSGKSQLGMSLAMMSAISGKKTVYIDPKNDSLGMAELQDELDGHLQIKDLNDGSQTGKMDPLITESTPEKKVAKATALVRILVGNITNDQETLLQPMITTVAYGSDPSLSNLTNLLLRRRETELSVIGTKLQTIQQSDPMSGLLFKRGRGETEIDTIDDGLTIITVLGLKMPALGANPESYEPKERLSLGIMYLIVDFILTVMSDNAHKLEPKTVLIDEAWAFIASEGGRNAVSQLFRMGRSLNTACILMTQNITDLESSSDDKNSLLNSAVTRFAFRAEDKNEIQDLCESLGISYQSFGDVFPDLDTGTCIMKDYLGRVSRVHIIQQNARWVHSFETNPMKKRMQIESEEGQDE